MTHYVIIAVSYSGDLESWGPYLSTQQARDDWRTIAEDKGENWRGNLEHMRIIAVQQPMCYA